MFPTSHHIPRLYQVLEVPIDASQDDIRKAYRRLAMKYHPDKAGANNAAAAELFKEINEAQMVLSDPRRRALYNRFGDLAINTERGEFSNMLLNSFSINTLYFAFSLAFFVLSSAVIAQLACVSARIDGAITWPWLSVLWPLWVVDFILLVVGIIFLGVILVNLCVDGEDSELRPGNLLGLVVGSGYIISSVLVGLKLDGLITDLCLVIFSPIFFVELILVVQGFWYLDVRGGIRKNIGRHFPAYEPSFVVVFALGTGQIILFTFRVLFFVLVAVRVDGFIMISWWVTVIPILLLQLSQVLLTFATLSIGEDLRQIEEGSKYVQVFFNTIFLHGIFLISLGLVVNKLDNGGRGVTTLALSCIPWFIQLAIVWGITGTTLVVTCRGAKHDYEQMQELDDLQEEERAQQEEPTVVVPMGGISTSC